MTLFCPDRNITFCIFQNTLFLHLTTYSIKLEHTKQKESGFEEVDWLDKMMLVAAIAGVGLVGAYLAYFNFL